MAAIHPHGQVENVTAPSAPSAGGSPDGDGEATEDSEFTARFFLLPSTRQPPFSRVDFRWERSCASVISVTSVAGLFSKADLCPPAIALGLLPCAA
ncbi:MAG: hypothetical protein ACOX52_14580 [Verrucomicrobiota bacterium]